MRWVGLISDADTCNPMPPTLALRWDVSHPRELKINGQEIASHPPPKGGLEALCPGWIHVSVWQSVSQLWQVLPTTSKAALGEEKGAGEAVATCSFPTRKTVSQPPPASPTSHPRPHTRAASLSNGA
jgi:hypothetical protein